MLLEKLGLCVALSKKAESTASDDKIRYHLGRPTSNFGVTRTVKTLLRLLRPPVPIGTSSRGKSMRVVDSIGVDRAQRNG